MQGKQKYETEMTEEEENNGNVPTAEYTTQEAKATRMKKKNPEWE